MAKGVYERCAIMGKRKGIPVKTSGSTMKCPECGKVFDNPGRSRQSRYIPRHKHG